MKRYWMVEDKDGLAVAFDVSLAIAGMTSSHLDKQFECWSPHRVVPVIEHTEALETLVREAIANVDSVTCKDLRDAILAVKEELES